MNAAIQYITRVAAWLSQGANCILLGGSPDQTVSARCYVNRNQLPWAIAYRAVNALFFWQEDHCRDSHAADVEFAQKVLRATVVSRTPP